MPDFNKMVSKDSGFEDPYDTEWMSSYLKNPLGESSNMRQKHKTSVTLDIQSALQSMISSEKFKNTQLTRQTSSNVLNESPEEEKLELEDQSKFYVIEED